MAENLIGPHSGLTTDVDTTQRNPLLTVAKSDAGGEYIYLAGVTSLAAKDAVVYDENGVTTRTVAGSVGFVAIAQAAVDASTKFGWFCIKSPLGGVTGKAGAAVADNKALYLHASTGTFDDAVVTGDLVVGAFSRSAPTGAADMTIQIDHPQVGASLE